MSGRKLGIKEGVKDSFPIAMGYFPIAVTFGILAKSSGLLIHETLGLSFIVFAGASQFVAAGLFGLGASGMEIILTTLFLNFRHFIMSASLAPKIHIQHPLLKPIIGFFVTDESFSVASFAKGTLTEKYMIPMELIPYFSWGIGSLVGYSLGSILPTMIKECMGIGLYAMFVALLVPECKKSKPAILMALSGGLINSGLQYLLKIPQGWSIIIAIIISATIGVFVQQKKEVAYE